MWRERERDVVGCCDRHFGPVSPSLQVDLICWNAISRESLSALVRVHVRSFQLKFISAHAHSAPAHFTFHFNISYNFLLPDRRGSSKPSIDISKCISKRERESDKRVENAYFSLFFLHTYDFLRVPTLNVPLAFSPPASLPHINNKCLGDNIVLLLSAMRKTLIQIYCNFRSCFTLRKNKKRMCAESRDFVDWRIWPTWLYHVCSDGDIKTSTTRERVQ